MTSDRIPTPVDAPAASMPLAITMGDACGIGPEIVLKSFADPSFDRRAVVVGDVGMLAREAARLRLPLQVVAVDGLDLQRLAGLRASGTTSVAQLPDEGSRDPAGATAGTRIPPIGAALATGPFLPADLGMIGPMRERLATACSGREGIVPVLPTSSLPVDLPLGRVDARAGRAAHDAVRAGAALAHHGLAAAIVTAPLHKEALSAAGVPFPGHTEMLAACAGLQPGDVAMMLVNDELRTLLVSIHVSLREAIARVTRANVLRAIRFADAALRRAGLAAPRVAVAGLNPHAGEGGLFGTEEAAEIVPAVADARATGIDASGPWPGDTVFARARGFRDFDIVVAMYHDQGLIPVKYLGIDTGVNATVGLPFVRTSVDHGTAFDIAGQDRADHRSLLAAIRVARQLAR